MATPAAVLSILVKADTKAAQASLVKANRSLKATAGRMDDTDKAAKRAQKGYARITTAAYAAGGGLVVAGLAAKKAFREFEEAEKATQQTRAVLKSTGDAAKVTATRGSRTWPRSCRCTSGVDDEAIESGEEPAADVHEGRQRGRQGQPRPPTRGTVADRGHVGGAGAGA